MPLGLHIAEALAIRLQRRNFIQQLTTERLDLGRGGQLDRLVFRIRAGLVDRLLTQHLQVAEQQLQLGACRLFLRQRDVVDLERAIGVISALAAGGRRIITDCVVTATRGLPRSARRDDWSPQAASVHSRSAMQSITNLFMGSME